MNAAATWFAIAATALLLGACGGFDDAPAAPGLRGAPCYFNEDCSRPLACGVPAGAPFSVCTGSQPEGAPCNPALPCQYVRDAFGLPLACLEGTCTFPAAAAATAGAP
jgi:hypothetical protein